MPDNANPTPEPTPNPTPTPAEAKHTCPACESEFEGKTILKHGAKLTDLEGSNQTLRDENERLRQNPPAPAPAPAPAANPPARKIPRGILRKRRKAA